MQAPSPLRDVRVDSYCKYFFHAGCLQHKIFEGGLHRLPQYTSHIKTVLYTHLN